MSALEIIDYVFKTFQGSFFITQSTLQHELKTGKQIDMSIGDNRSTVHL